MESNKKNFRTSNLDFRHFDPAKRVHVDLQEIKFGVLNDLFATGEDYLTELESAREKAKAQAKAVEEKSGRKNETKKRKCASESLRERDPW